MGYVIGVDIGGTFTDCVAVDERGGVFHGKALSTHATTPVDGVLDGLSRLAEAAGTSVEGLLTETTRLSHGTTIGTNLVVERKGANVRLLATRGHGDALAMMRGNGRTAGAAPDAILNVRATDRPVPLVQRRMVTEVCERVARDGSVLAPLSQESAEAAVATTLDDAVEAVAIALMWGFRNPEHERRLRQLILERRPDLYVSISSETAPRQGEYERTVATVINSYVGPASSRYLQELGSALRERGLDHEPYIMQSNGGVVPIDVAGQLPVQTIGSGPAGGLAGTVAIAEQSGHSKVIATDMGGTSFEVGLIIDGRPILSGEQVLDQYTFRVSHLDIRSIACGGGSIAHVDAHGGGLRVGPQSAGSDPGPACYGKGSLPTVTDADVVLGLLDPDEFLSGRMRLDREAAVAAVGTVAGELGLGIEEAAAGIIRVNNHNAATLIRQRTIEQGLDPREFALYAFGGAGPVHAFGFAAELGIDEVVIPMGNGASTLSAYGIAATDARRVFEQECSLLAPLDAAELGGVVGETERRAVSAMVDSGYDATELVVERTALARYAEQYMHELPLPIAPGQIDEAAATAFEFRFAEEYGRLYGEAAVAVFNAIEIFAIRVTVSAPHQTPAARADGEQAAEVPATERDVYWPEAGAWTRTAVWRGAPRRGVRIAGPAVVQLPHTVVAVAPGQWLEADVHGTLELHLTGVSTKGIRR